MSDCSVCLGQHDEEIHAATLRVRKWFRTQIQPVKIAKAAKRKVVDPRVELPQFTQWAVFRRYGKGSGGTGEVKS